MIKSCKKPKPWEIRKYTYQEWGKMDFDWLNEHKLDQTIVCYFWRIENYEKGQKNEHILRSTFGMKTEYEIQQEIQYWFNASVGAYNEIELT